VWRSVFATEYRADVVCCATRVLAYCTAGALGTADVYNAAWGTPYVRWCRLCMCPAYGHLVGTIGRPPSWHGIIHETMAMPRKQLARQPLCTPVPPVWQCNSSGMADNWHAFAVSCTVNSCVAPAATEALTAHDGNSWCRANPSMLACSHSCDCMQQNIRLMLLVWALLHIPPASRQALHKRHHSVTQCTPHACAMRCTLQQMLCSKQGRAAGFARQ
jgi:hypothetical protein